MKVQIWFDVEEYTNSEGEPIVIIHQGRKGPKFAKFGNAKRYRITVHVPHPIDQGKELEDGIAEEVVNV